MIVAQNPHRNALRPLLTVSRGMYSIVVPLIYETIVIPYQAASYLSSRADGLVATHGPCSAISAFHVHYLHSTLKENPALGEYTTTFVAEEFYYCYGDHRKMITCFPRLQRLLHILGDDLVVPQSIAASVSLTHLVIPMCSPEPLSNLLYSQRKSLRSLQLGEVADLSLYLPSNTTLDSLHTFEVTLVAGLDAIFKIAPIRHLSLIDLSEDSIDNPEMVMSKLTTLFIHRVSSRQALCMLCPYLKKIEALHLSFTMDETEDIQIQDILNIPSKSLRYIHLARVNPHISLIKPIQPITPFPDVQTLYDRYPSLVAVDVKDSRSTSTHDPLSHTFRYLNHLTSPVLPGYDYPTTFEHSWEPLRRSLGISE
ncbi:hypothetical protein ONZ45_g5787 [Pleurotus djamor]|nr:hypothetical protein ONZ45_g5787 [Pleurotus djamor]